MKNSLGVTTQTVDYARRPGHGQPHCLQAVPPRRWRGHLVTLNERYIYDVSGSGGRGRGNLLMVINAVSGSGEKPIRSSSVSSAEPRPLGIGPGKRRHQQHHRRHDAMESLTTTRTAASPSCWAAPAWFMNHIEFTTVSATWSPRPPRPPCCGWAMPVTYWMPLPGYITTKPVIMTPPPAGSFPLTPRVLPQEIANLYRYVGNNPSQPHRFSQRRR